MSELAHSGTAPVTWGNFNTHIFLQLTKAKCSLDINQACEQHKLNSYAKQYEERFDLSNRGGYGWMPHNASFVFLDLTPSILLLRQFWD
jgi:hypothetical protein